MKARKKLMTTENNQALNAKDLQLMKENKLKHTTDYFGMPILVNTVNHEESIHMKKGSVSYKIGDKQKGASRINSSNCEPIKTIILE